MQSLVGSRRGVTSGSMVSGTLKRAVLDVMLLRHSLIKNKMPPNTNRANIISIRFCFKKVIYLNHLQNLNTLITLNNTGSDFLLLFPSSLLEASDTLSETP